MKKAVLVVQAPHHTPWLNAFAEGLRKHDWQAQVSSGQVATCDMMVLWGTKHAARFGAQEQLCILERGYVGDRYKWTSVSFGGGLNNRGIFRGPFHDGSRWNAHFAHLLESWKADGEGSALILGQVPHDMSVKGVDLNAFYWKAVEAFEDRGFEVKFRPHPLAPHERCHGAMIAGGSLARALAGAAVSISWNSNASVEAVLAGVPSVTIDEGAMAYAVTGHELRLPPMPEREKWAQWLAWCQYSMEEMSSGYCWDVLETYRSCVQAA